MKGQTVRLFDVFFIGPAMVFAGYHLRNRALGTVIAGLGISTIVYNLLNYMEMERLQHGSQRK